MKTRTIILMVLAVVVTAVGVYFLIQYGERKKENDLIELIESQIKNADSDTLRKDTLNFGLVIGMSQDEVLKKLVGLEKEGIIFKKYGEFYCYIKGCGFKKAEYQAAILPQFINDKFYQLALDVDGNGSIYDLTRALVNSGYYAFFIHDFENNRAVAYYRNLQISVYGAILSDYRIMITDRTFEKNYAL